MIHDDLNKNSFYPFVSIVVPLYNEAPRVTALLGALENQTYPCFEIVLVDNGSTDSTAAVARKNGGRRVKTVSEFRWLSPDLARNTGVAAATGEIIAFTDADCLPDREWLSNAVECLVSQGAAMVAGRIDFLLPERPNAAEWYDSISFLQHAESVAQRGVAFTCNLTMPRSVFYEAGGFSTKCVWNGDTLFTRAATRRGMKLVYADRARIRHPTRSWKALCAKVWRIAYWKGYEGSAADPTSFEPAKLFFIQPKPHFRHLNPFAVAASIKKRGGNATLLCSCSVAALAWAMGAVAGFAFLVGRLKKVLASQSLPSTT